MNVPIADFKELQQKTIDREDELYRERLMFSSRGLHLYVAEIDCRIEEVKKFKENIRLIEVKQRLRENERLTAEPKRRRGRPLRAEFESEEENNHAR